MVVWDSKVRWKKHSESLTAKWEKGLYLIRKFTRIHWDADCNTMLKIYRSIIRPILDYGCIIYNSARDSILKNSDIILNKSLRVSLSVIKTSPSKAITHAPPVQLRREFLFKCLLQCKCLNEIGILLKYSIVTTMDFTNRYFKKLQLQTTKNVLIWQRVLDIKQI